MSLATHFLKPAVAPLNFANVSMMGGLIDSGLKELAAENLLAQLKKGVAGAAKAASVRPGDIEKLLPMARFIELAAGIDRDQKVAFAAWKELPVDPKRASDLAKLTEAGKLPVLSDSLMRLSIMAGANAPLRTALAGMAPALTEWQRLVLESGNKLDDNRALTGAFMMRTVRRVGLGVLLLGSLGPAVWLWQRGEAARARVAMQIGSDNPCAVLSIDPGDLDKANAEQKKSIGERKTACEVKRAKDAKEKEERDKLEAYAKGCSDLGAALANGRQPGRIDGVAMKDLQFANRVAKGSLDGADFGPKDPPFPCADTDAVASVKAAFDKALVASDGWMDVDDLSPHVRAALEKHADRVPEATKKALDDRAEAMAVDALKSREVGKAARAKRLCDLKKLFKLPHRSFCKAVTP
jgi:hypothetical protein